MNGDYTFFSGVPPPPQINPNFFFHQNSNSRFPFPPPNFLFPNPPHNFPFQNPNFNPNLNPPNLNPPNPPNLGPFINDSITSPSIETIDRAVDKARVGVLAGGGHVAAWEVSKAALAELRAESWEVLGVLMQQVPSLYRLIATQGKINAFIHCFVAVQRICTLYDLDKAICNNEGVERFEELELGPLVRHPLAIHYFSINYDANDILNITSEEIISYLANFIDIHKGDEIAIDEFLDFAAKKRSVSGREKLNVRIQSFGMHVTFIRQAKRSNKGTLKRCLKDVGVMDEDFGSYNNISSPNPGGSIQPSHNDNKECLVVPKRKRKSENKSDNITRQCKLPKTVRDEPDFTVKNKIEFAKLDESVFSLDENSMRMFVMLWKKACQKNSVSEVFWKMLRFYKINSRKEKAKDWFLSHPFIGLLNVAVTSIERGMWDNVCNNLQDFVHHGVADMEAEKHTLRDRVDAELPGRDAMGKTRKNIKGVTVDDIVKKVSTYFECDLRYLSKVDSLFGLKLQFVRKLFQCEDWLAEQFSVKNFNSLGHGKFVKFLEKHFSMLHDALQKGLTLKKTKKSPLEVCMLEQQLTVLLSQAAHSLGKDENINKDMIPPLLTKQFPSVNFVIAEKGVSKGFLDRVKKKGSISTSVLFSAPLLARQGGEKTVGSVTAEDAINVLLKAPMLSNLISWTHWDIVFAPSLGPLVRWLLNGVKSKKLLCLVTKDGKVIKIDSKASVESFSKACLRGCSFQAAVQLLSVLSLYGGEKHVPMSLLKRHARQAFEEIIKKNSGKTVISGRDRTVCKRARVAATQFFIDCLCYLPSDFQAFAADILLSGLQFVLKDALLVTLQKCKEIGRRHLLHNIGLSLGIVKWINDYHLFSSTITNNSPISSLTSCLEIVDRDTSNESYETLQIIHGSENRIDQIPADHISNSWPPVDWKSTPGFNFPHPNGMDMQSAKSGNNSIKTAEKTDLEVITESDAGCNGSAIKECDRTIITATVVLQNSFILDNESDVLNSNRGGHSHRITGRLGEHVAYNYFLARVGDKKVTWVNQHLESALPYDLVIEDKQRGLEYIEVKATRSLDKDWLHISLREWLFAMEQGERFTIAHVVLSDDLARINMFKNPAKLCQLGKLQLAIILPKLLEEYSNT